MSYRCEHEKDSDICVQCYEESRPEPTTKESDDMTKEELTSACAKEHSEKSQECSKLRPITADDIIKEANKSYDLGRKHAKEEMKEQQQYPRWQDPKKEPPLISGFYFINGYNSQYWYNKPQAIWYNHCNNKADVVSVPKYFLNPGPLPPLPEPEPELEKSEAERTWDAEPHGVLTTENSKSVVKIWYISGYNKGHNAATQAACEKMENLKGHFISLYNRDNGEGAAERVIEGLTHDNTTT